MSGEEDIQALVVDNGELIFSIINFLNVLHIYFLQFRTMKFSITRFMEHKISFFFFPVMCLFLITAFLTRNLNIFSVIIAIIYSFFVLYLYILHNFNVVLEKGF